jgi:hypothetical protein
MHCTLWGIAGQEQRPTRASGAPVSQIRCKRLAHINRQRQTVDAVTLAADNNLSCPPVDATQFEVSHLGCPQAKPGQKREDGEIAQPGWVATVAAIQ